MQFSEFSQCRIGRISLQFSLSNFLCISQCKNNKILGFCSFVRFQDLHNSNSFGIPVRRQYSKKAVSNLAVGYLAVSILADCNLAVGYMAVLIIKSTL